MIFKIYTRDQGVMDFNLKADDIFSFHQDDYIPGEKDKQRFLIVKIDGIDDTEAVELVEPEFGVGPGASPVIRRQRKYRLNWRSRLDPEITEAILDPLQSVEVIVGEFTKEDIIRK